MKRIFTIAFVLAFLTGLLPASVAFAGTTVTIDLMAGQTTKVGTVTVSDDGVNMTVLYEITEPGWTLTATHLYVGTTAPKSGAPGQYPYQHTGLSATTDSYTVPITAGIQYYVAAHAVVQSEASGTIVGWNCPTLDEAAAMLPASGVVYANNKYNPYSYWDVIISSAGILNGTYPGWCIDQTHSLFANYHYPASFYSSDGGIPADLTSGTDPYIDHPENLDLVNWVINNHDGYTVYEVQNVIWHLIDANPYEPLTANEQILYDAALTHEGFVPDFASGDVFTVIVVPIVNFASTLPYHQIMMVEVEMECTPIYAYQSETSWALAPGGTPFRTGWGMYFTYMP